MKHPGSLPWLPAALAALFVSCVTSPPPDNRGSVSPGDSAGNEIAAPPDRLVPVTTLPVQQTSFAGLAMAPVTAAAMRYPTSTLAADSAPLSLTASDGTGLRLVSLDARAVIEGPLAFTELQLRFANPLDRTIEGRFSITLPEGAAISRLAMRLDTGWQEAEVVELQAARRAYEDFLHRRQDPALLEKEAGNEFNARIFPIPARGTKDIIISYSQNLAHAGAAYRLPLRGLPVIDSLRVSALVGQRKGNALAYQPVGMQQSAYKPDRDFEVAVPADVAGVRHGQLVAARARPDVRSADQRIERLVVLFDTSASRAPGFAGSVAQLGQIVAALAQAHGDLALTVAAFDQVITPIYEGAAAGFGKAELDAVLARRPLGASDLHAALTWAGERGGRVVLVTDAIATVGPNEGDALRASVHALRDKVQRLDVILAGGIKDRALAERMARGTLRHDGVVLDAEQPAAELARRLGQSTVSNVKVEVAGAEWVWPRTLDGVQPGDEVLVFAELGARNAPAPGKPLPITLTGPVGENGTQKVPVLLAGVARPLIERAAAQATIEMLTAQRDTLGDAPDAAARREQLRKQIIDVSTRHRVLSDYTALLVLETEADYVRYGIDRKALADVLTVGPRGLEVVQRGAPVLLMATGQPAQKPRAPRNLSRHDLPPSTGDTGAPSDEDDVEAEKKSEMAAPEAEEMADGVEGGVPGGVVGGVVGSAAPGMPAPAASLREGRMGRGGGGRAERRRAAPAAAPAAEPPPPPVAQPAPDSAPARRQSTIAAAPSEIAVEADARPAAKVQGTPPFTGKLAEVMQLLASRRIEQALTLAVAWQNDAPGDVMALIALGEALEAAGRPALAARAYGSLIDLFPGRADMRRMAGERLERLTEHGNALATDTYAKAVAQRPDHLTGHRLLAYALVRQGKYAQAFDAAMAGLAREYPSGRFEGGERILREDLGLIAAAWLRHEPAARSTVESRLASAGAMLATEPSLRFVLTWETDANDVDFHIHDGKGGHAYYSQRQLASGGELYADVTTGYGPECFAIPGPGRAFPYQLQIHYYSRGPMGYGMGKLEILDHDGKGNLRFEQRPFVVMNDGAYVDLGTVGGQALAR